VEQKYILFYPLLDPLLEKVEQKYILFYPLLEKVEQKIIDERIDKVADIFAPLFLKVDKVE